MNRKKTNLISFLSICLLFLLLAIVTWIFFVFSRINLYTFFVLCMVSSIYFFQSIVAFWVLNSNRFINVKLCWIFAIYFLPLIGMMLFLMLGIIPLHIKNYKSLKLDNEKFNKYEDYTFTKKYIKDNKSTDFNFIYNLSEAPIYENNKITLVKQSDLVKISLEIIEQAKEFIHINYYIISESIWFDLIIEELIKKAKENVKIRFLYDWVGSFQRVKNSSLKRMEKAGIEIENFNPKNFIFFTSNSNFRSHRKAIIVDNKICLSGGSNIGDEYINLKKGYDNWIDCNYLIQGEIVNSINLTFCNDFLNYSSYALKKNKDRNFYNKYKIYPYMGEEKNISQIINSGPNINKNPFFDILISKISSAKKRICIVSPYFLIDNFLISQLQYASIKGVEVTIILPNLPDNKKWILTFNRSNYLQLLESKIKIYEYLGFVHSKIILIDDEFSILGTNNMDFRSLFLNYETGILFQSNKINSDLDELIISYIENSIEIKKDNLKQIYNFSEKVKMIFLNIIHPLL